MTYPARSSRKHTGMATRIAAWIDLLQMTCRRNFRNRDRRLLPIRADQQSASLMHSFPPDHSGVVPMHNSHTKSGPKYSVTKGRGRPSFEIKDRMDIGRCGHEIRRRLNLFAFVTFICLIFFSADLTSARASDNQLPYRMLMEKFGDNSELKPEELDLLPSALRSYLMHGQVDWKKHGVTGFSRKISNRHVIFSTHRDSFGLNSKAAIYSTNGQWTRLFLPYIRDDGSVFVSQYHSNLRWSSDTNIFHTTVCSDVLPGELKNICTRYFFDIHWKESSLIRIEGLIRSFGRKRAWTTIWEKGQWVDGR